MTAVNADFFSCDWGTSSFRLRWVSGTDGKLLREIREPVGIKAIHDGIAGSNTTSQARGEIFGQFLRTRLVTLVNGEPPTHPLPLVISGMASSSVGWRELPYAAAPFALDGRGLATEQLQWDKPDWVGTTYLISGVANQYEMMRGEETEIIGLMTQPELSAMRQRALLILPGTHSKHVWLDDDSVVDFRTFMTGELFEVLGRQSLLRASIDPTLRLSGDSVTESDRLAFQEGALWGNERGLAGGLFRVRTRAVLNRAPLADNTWFFSGLLIGAEVASLGAHARNRPVIIAAAGPLAELYMWALEAVGSPALKWTCLPPEQVERATMIAHALFLRNRSATH